MKHKILLQVAAPAIVMGLSLVVTGLGSAWSIHRLQANLGSIVQESVASAQASLELESSLRRLRYHSLLYLMRPAPDVLRQIEDDEREFEAAFADAERSATLPEEQDLLREIGAGFAAYRGEMAQLRAEVDRAGPRSDFARLATEHPIRHMTTRCRRLGKLNTEQLEATAGESNALSARSRLILVLLGLAGPLGGLVVGYGITLGLTRSITKLQVQVRDVADRLRSEGDGIQMTLTADGGLQAMERQMGQVVRRAEEMVQRLQVQQREILRGEQLAALGQLAACVAHEVRNPLTGMKLLVEAALRPARPRDLSREDLEVIHGEIARLEETVRHFLDFARPQPLARQVTDLREAVARPVDLVRGRARQQGVHLRVVLPDEPLPVDLDAGQFGTALVNLLLNALDALPRGGEVSVEARPGAGGCNLQVRDTGPGVAPDLLARLFTPFVSGKPTGTGLGLSQARRVVEGHGGQIHAANQPGGGACFTILLPLAAGPAHTPEEAACPGCL
jgi:two-component system, NtrC family, sensor histidine kinase HydH